MFSECYEFKLLSVSTESEADPRRDALLRRLLKASGWQQLAREVVEAAREELGIPRSRLFRLVARFRRTKRTTSLLPQATGTPRGAKRIDPKVGSLITEQIDRYWLKKERASLSSLMRRVHDACRVEGLRPPRTVARLSDASMNSSRVLRRAGEGRGISWWPPRLAPGLCGEPP